MGYEILQVKMGDLQVLGEEQTPAGRFWLGNPETNGAGEGVGD